MKFSTAIAYLATVGFSLSDVSASYFGYDIPEYPTITDVPRAWAGKPDFVPLEPCKEIYIDSNTKFDHTIEVDHCLLDCKGHALRGHDIDPVVYVRNGGQLVNCPVEVEQYGTGIVCDNGDCFLLDVSCHGDKNFDECVLVKNQAKNVVVLLLEAVDPNGTYGLRAINAYNANIWLEDSKIQYQRKDGVLATHISNLVMSHDDISYNKWDGVDARNVANYVVGLASYFNDNGDDGFDTKRIKNFVFAFNEANRNKKNGLEIVATRDAYLGIFHSHLDNNGFGTREDQNDNQNGLFIEGPNTVDMTQVFAQYNKGDGVKMNNVHYLNVHDSEAAYNQADGFDLRRITRAKLYKVQAYQNKLTGVRAFANGELYVEDDSNFFENGLDSRFESKNRSGLSVVNTKKAFISGTTSYKNGGYGFFTNNVPELYIEYTKAYENHDDGFDIETSANVEIKYDTVSSNNKANGFSLADISRLYFSEHVQAFYNEKRGFDIQDVDHVEVRKTDSFNNYEDGFYIAEVQYFYVEASVSARNLKDGIFVDNGKVHTEVVFNDVIACENKDDGMVFQEGFDEGALWFTPNDDVFSCDNGDLDLQFDGDFDFDFGSSDLQAADFQPSATTTTNVQARSFGINDITADTCADANGDERVLACQELNIAPCHSFVCPSFH
jgi:Right handed beta helix region